MTNLVIVKANIASLEALLETIKPTTELFKSIRSAVIELYDAESELEAYAPIKRSNSNFNAWVD